MKLSAAAITELISSHQGLVKSIALKITESLPTQFELDDLIGYGQVGLAEAAQEFDPARGVRFATYAYYRVRGAIYDKVDLRIASSASNSWPTRPLPSRWKKVRRLILKRGRTDRTPSAFLAKR